MIANIFGKIFAKQQKLTAQSRVSSINRQIARKTKEIGRAEKQLNQWKRSQVNNVKTSNSIFSNNSMFAQALAADGAFADILTNGKLDNNKITANRATYDQYVQAMETMKIDAQQQLQAQLDQIEQEYEWQHEMVVEALKDEQADLEAEKATAEAQVQLYEGVEQQEKQFADSNIKNMFS